jgi:hypothetical protein
MPAAASQASPQAKALKSRTLGGAKSAKRTTLAASAASAARSADPADAASVYETPLAALERSIEASATKQSGRKASPSAKASPSSTQAAQLQDLQKKLFSQRGTLSDDAEMFQRSNMKKRGAEAAEINTIVAGILPRALSSGLSADAFLEEMGMHDAFVLEALRTAMASGKVQPVGPQRPMYAPVVPMRSRDVNLGVAEEVDAEKKTAALEVPSADGSAATAMMRNIKRARSTLAAQGVKPAPLTEAQRASIQRWVGAKPAAADEAARALLAVA